MGFKIGDKVVIVDNTDAMCGQHGVIVDIDTFNRVKFPSGYIAPMFDVDLEICEKVRGFDVCLSTNLLTIKIIYAEITSQSFEKKRKYHKEN